MSMQTPRLDDSQPPDPLRRRLAKGGLAIPVVLSTLGSKPVLGQGPSNCTCSGQLSGNVSSPGMAAEQCKTGRTPDDWRDLCKQGIGGWGSYGGNYFNKVSSGGSTFADAFHCVTRTETTTTTTNQVVACTKPKDIKAGKICTKPVTTTTSTTLGTEVVDATSSRLAGKAQVATVLQVLESAAAGNVPLGRAAIASFLNATELAPNYPMTPKQVIDMFNAVYAGGSYLVNGSTPWSASQVLEYWETLY